MYRHRPRRPRSSARRKALTEQAMIDSWAYCRTCSAGFEPTEHQQRKRDFLCPQCKLDYDRSYRARRRAAGNPVIPGTMSREYQRRYKKEYKKRPGVLARLAARARQLRKNPLYLRQEAARRAVRIAIERGELVRLTCETCGMSPTDGHHEDYSKPLVVRWLCRQCHATLHALAKEDAP